MRLAHIFIRGSASGRNHKKCEPSFYHGNSNRQTSKVAKLEPYPFAVAYICVHGLPILLDPIVASVIHLPCQVYHARGWETWAEGAHVYKYNTTQNVPNPTLQRRQIAAPAQSVKRSRSKLKAQPYGRARCMARGQAIDGKYIGVAVSHSRYTIQINRKLHCTQSSRHKSRTRTHCRCRLQLAV